MIIIPNRLYQSMLTRVMIQNQLESILDQETSLHAFQKEITKQETIN